MIDRSTQIEKENIYIFIKRGIIVLRLSNSSIFITRNLALTRAYTTEMEPPPPRREKKEREKEKEKGEGEKITIVVSSLASLVSKLKFPRGNAMVASACILASRQAVNYTLLRGGRAQLL